MPPTRDTALILRRAPFGESSLVVQVLTRRHGRVHFMAKGAYRPTSGYAFALDLFHTLTLEWSPSSRRELQLLRRADLEVRRAPTAAGTYRAALSVLELAELAARPGQPAPELFAMTSAALDAFDALARGEGGDGADERATRRAAVDRTLLRFELAFLDSLGLAPSLLDCAACGGPAPPRPGENGKEAARAHFSAGAGGRLCRDCALEARGAGRRVGTLPVDVLEIAHALGSGAEGAASEVPGEVLVRTRDAIERFLNYHLETRPRTQRKFLAAPNRNAP